MLTLRLEFSLPVSVKIRPIRVARLVARAQGAVYAQSAPNSTVSRRKLFARIYCTRLTAESPPRAAAAAPAFDLAKRPGGLRNISSATPKVCPRPPRKYSRRSRNRGLVIRSALARAEKGKAYAAGCQIDSDRPRRVSANAREEARGLAAASRGRHSDYADGE